MSAKFDVIDRDWCEIVFENHNKQYGAYQLRREYDRNLILGIVFTMTLSGGLMSLPYISARLFPEATSQMPDPITDVFTFDKPPVFDIEQPKIEPAPEASQPKVTTEKYVEPVIVPDPQVTTNTMTTNENLGNVNTSTTTTTGTTNITTFRVEPQPTPVPESSEALRIVEVMPVFPGGDQALFEYLKRNIRYPDPAKAVGIQGRVYVSFIIGADGRVSRAEIIKSVKGLDAEALRVIQNMPAWTPGRQGGVAVPVQFVLPIQFRIE